MGIANHDRSSWLKLFFFSFWLFLLAACGGDPTSRDGMDDGGDEGRVLWEAGEQYVRLVAADTVVANQHPAAITPEEMQLVLESLSVPERRFIRKQLNPIFSPGEIQILSVALTRGLALARPNQDVTFVTTGFQPGTFTQTRKANTGRVFFKDNKLHLIFGMIHHEVRATDRQTGEQIDRRLHPFRVGSRYSETELSPPPALTEGQVFYVDPKHGEEREDWLVLDIPALVARAEDGPAAEEQLSPALLEDIARNKQETENIREELIKIKEVLFDFEEALQEIQQGKGSTPIEERLQVLKNLHDNGLISGDEYQAKRRELLDKL
jgi:hypothetical protein